MKDYRRAAVQFDIIITGNVDLPKASKKKGKVSLQVRAPLSSLSPLANLNSIDRMHV